MYDDEPSDGGWMTRGWAPGGEGPVGIQALTQQEHAFLNLPPELFFASGLFQGCYTRRREYVRNCPIQSTCADRTLRYTGVRLDQCDLDVFLACAVRFPRQMGSAPCTRKVSILGLAREVLKNVGVNECKRISDSLRRLEAGRIKIRDGRFACYLQPIQKALFDTEAGYWLIELNPEMLRSLQGMGNLQAFIRERFMLPRVSMDRWLHGLMYCSSRICLPFNWLPALSGNANAVPVQLEKSLNRLRASVRSDRLSLGEGGLEISRNSRMAAGLR